VRVNFAAGCRAVAAITVSAPAIVTMEMGMIGSFPVMA
jgi:hypothetical protein